MSYNVCIYQLVFLYSVLCMFCAQADELGRLFTTPEERVYLQQLRHSQSANEATAESEAEAVADIDSITLGGIVYRASGKSTIWINGQHNYAGNLASQYLTSGHNPISSKAVSVTLPKTGLQLELKVGQTYRDGVRLDIDGKQVDVGSVTSEQ